MQMLLDAFHTNTFGADATKLAIVAWACGCAWYVCEAGRKWCKRYDGHVRGRVR